MYFQAFILYSVFSLSVLLLHLVIPATIIDGYVCKQDSNMGYRPLQFRINGLRVLFAIIVLGGLISYFWPSLIFYIVYNVTEYPWMHVRVASDLGLLISVVWYLKGRNLALNVKNIVREVTADQIDLKTGQLRMEHPERQSKETVEDKGFIYYFYAGVEFNPRNVWSSYAFDWKMFLYLIGCSLLVLNLMCASIRQYVDQGQLSTGMAAYIGMLMWFVVDYLYNEHVHLYTYDFFAEKLGFKLNWGCLCFLPYFYTIGVWGLLESSYREMTTVEVFFVYVLFMLGYFLSRGANNQKFHLKKNPNKPYFGIIPITIPGTKILCSGWWGVARHINYLGEILMATAISIPSVMNGWLYAILYPMFFIILLILRDWHDNKLCFHKYGDKWLEYCKRVPYRIVPFIY